MAVTLPRPRAYFTGTLGRVQIDLCVDDDLIGAQFYIIAPHLGTYTNVPYGSSRKRSSSGAFVDLFLRTT
jgi:hypothetical protein